MRLLFAISIASFCAALSVALSFTRRVKIQRIRRRRPPLRRRWQTQEFFEAGEFRTPRRLRLRQELARTGTRPARALALTNRAVVDRPLASAKPVVLCPPGTFLAPYRVPVTSFPTVPARRGAAHLQPSDHPAAHRQNVISISNLAPPAPPRRKAPQPARPDSMRRFDLSRFGKNTGGPGDLSDPYTSLLRSSGTQGPMLRRP